MGSKSTFILFFFLSYASCILQIRGKHLLQHAHNESNLEGGFTAGQRFSNSPQNSSISIAESSDYIYDYASYSLDEALHGVRAKITVWEIDDVQPLSNSSAYIGAYSIGTDGSVDNIFAGVHVSPALYNGSLKLRFFTYWSSYNNYNGCYNLNCPGFVVADGANVHPGQPLEPLSVYGGIERYITIRIKKDQNTGDWSLYREDQGGPIGGMTLLGWWPKTLFTGLADHASMVTWTGAVVYPESERSPSMGSGHLASELNGKAASFKQMAAFGMWGGMIEPMPNMVNAHISNKTCYPLSPLYHTKHADRSHFFYGGPGGCSN